jgi:nucleoside-diphosphate-sugar epimerase
MRNLFITGASGFIGRKLVQRLDPREYGRIVCVSRTEPRQSSPQRAAQPAVQAVTADLRDPSSYARHLAGCDTVLHLAAATGAASRDESFAVNAEATRTLIEQAERLGVRDFLLVSTIAVNYPNAPRYPYAASKRLAETALRASRLRYAIVRPTIVISHDAPIWNTLSGLARRRLIVMPGTGQVRVQPIHVDELVGCVVALLRKDLFGAQLFEVGGADIASFEEFLRKIHRFASGREPSVIHLPLGPIMASLSLLERVVPRGLPVTAGQLSAFRYDSAIDPTLAFPDPAALRVPLDDMIRKCLADA